MVLKATGSSPFAAVDRWDGGSTWIAHPEESMERASHAIVVDGNVWLIDPVDVDGLDEHLAEIGDVCGVLVLLDRHKRDAGVIAARHGVPAMIPEWMDGVAGEIAAPVERFGTTVADRFDVYPLYRSRFWQEATLFDEEHEVLIVPESVGTASYFLTGDERLGVHPMLRVHPPKRLQQFDPERVLVGHGRPVSDRASAALPDALEGSIRRAPRLYLESMREMVFG